MKQYSADLRERLLGAIDAGRPLAGATPLFRVCPSTIRHWQSRQRSTGSVAARPRHGCRHRRGPGYHHPPRRDCLVSLLRLCAA